jgi:uncharacterized protein DUF4153
MSETPSKQPDSAVSEEPAGVAPGTPDPGPSGDAATPDAVTPNAETAAPAADPVPEPVPVAVATPSGAPIWPGPPVPGHLMPGQPVPGYAVPGQPGGPIPGQPVPGQPVPGQVWPGQPARPKPEPTLMEKHWKRPTGGAPRVTLSAVIVAAVVGAVALVLNRPGFGFFLTGAVLTAAVVVTARASRGDADGWSLRRNGERTFWTAITLALLAVGTFRDSGWLFFLCVVVALGTGSIALAGGRSVIGLLLALISWISAIFAAPLWFARGIYQARQNRGGPRVILAIVISVALLLVFGGLFAAADAEFAHVLATVMPKWTVGDVFRAVFCFVVVLALALGATYLAGSRPSYGEIRPGTWRSVRRIEWLLPLAVLNVLFAGFVYIQLTVLFRGDAALSAKSHKYMKGYAHSGFWQLVAVSLLTLTVIAVTSRIAARETTADRTSVRVLLGGLSVFSIVIVASALKRLAAYEHAYGYTRVRVVVGGFELWLGLLFLLVLVAGIRLRGGWLPQVIAGSFAVALFAGAIANPDYYVASHNVQRFQDTGQFSVEYMRQLSADAVPAIETLPTRLRNCSLRPIAVRLAATPDDWRTWNFSRADARDRIGVFYLGDARRCPALVGKP